MSSTSRLRKVFLLAFIILLSGNNTYGTTRYVEPSIGGGCGGNAQCYATINEAMDVSNNNDEIILMPGTHMGGNGNGGSIIPRRISCTGMNGLTIRGYKTNVDTGDWQPRSVIVEFGDDSENYGFGLTTRNTDAMCTDWWEQNHGHAADGWKIRGITFQKAKDYFGVMTGIYIAGQGETSHSNERFYDSGSLNIQVNNCIIRGFDLGIDVAHRTYTVEAPNASARIRNNKFYPYLVRYGVTGGDDNFYPKGHSFGAVRAQVNTKVFINRNVITIETPDGYDSLMDYIDDFAQSNPKAILRKAMPYRGIVLEVGDGGSASVMSNLIEYHNVGILNNGHKTNSRIGSDSPAERNIIQNNYIGIGNGPQTRVNIGGNIIGGLGISGNKVGIMDVGAFSTIKNNIINAKSPIWDTESTDNIGVFSIDSHYNYNYGHESDLDEFRPDMPEAQDVGSFGGGYGELNNIFVSSGMTGLSFYEYGTIGLPPGSGLASGQSFSLGLDRNAIVANQAFTGTGNMWAPPVEITVGVAKTYEQIQGAINAANPGQVVVVEPGSYDGNISNLLGIHVIAKKFRDDEDDSNGDGLIDGGDGFPTRGLGGWSNTIISGSSISSNRWSDGFENGISDWNEYETSGGGTLWGNDNEELQANSTLNDTGYSILWNPNPRANNTKYLNFRFNIQTTASKQNAYAVLRYSENEGSPNFVYFGVEINPNTGNYRFVIRKGKNGNIYDSGTPCPACTGIYSEWRNDGYITANTWYKMSLQVVSPGFFAMEISDANGRKGSWKVVFSNSFNRDSFSLDASTDGAGFMVEGSDTYFDNLNWSAGPLVSGHDLNMTSGFSLKDFIHQSGSVGFGSKAVSPLIKANTIALDNTSNISSVGVGMTTGAKPAIIGNVIKNTFVSIVTSGSLSSNYGITELKEESYYGTDRNTQPYMGGLVPNDLWSGPYIYNNHSSNASSANYRILPYSYGWVEKNYLTHNVGNNVNSSLINMVQGTEKFHGLMQITFLNNYLFNNTGGHRDGFGGQGVWTDNQDSSQTYLEAVFDGNFVYNVGVGFWSKRGGRNLKFINNRISSNLIGLSLDNETDGFIINNRIYNNSVYGAFVSGNSTRVTAAYNVFKGNYIGFSPSAQGSFGSRISNCDMLNNTFAGAEAGMGGNTRYTRNNFANNPIGLYVRGNGWHVVSNNSFLHNSVAGVKIYGDGAIRLRRNTFVAGWDSSFMGVYNPVGLIVIPDSIIPGSNADVSVGNIFFESLLGIALIDNSTCGQVTDNIVFGWDTELDVTDGENDGYWYVEQGSSNFGSNYSEQDYPNPKFMDPNHEDPRIDDYRLDPGPSYGIYGAASRSPLLDVVPNHPDQLGGTGIGMRIDPCYVAICWVGKNGYPDDLGPDGIAGTSDDYSDIDDVEEYRMTSGDVFSYPGSGNMSYYNDLIEYDFDLYGFKNDGGIKGKTGVERYLTKRKYYFKVVDTGIQTLNLDDVQIPYYPQADDGSPIDINGTFENGGVPDFTGWVELDGNQMGLDETYIINSTWDGVEGSYCIGTSGIYGINASSSNKISSIVIRTIPFRIDLRRGTKLKFRIGGDGGFIPLASNFKYNPPPSQGRFITCDINGDEKDDLIHYVVRNESISYIAGASLSWWDSSTNQWSSLLDDTHRVLSVLSSDINGDGKDDIVANIDDMGLYWRDSATNTWNPILDSTYTLLSTLSADINGDGKDDIVTNIENMGLYWRDSATNTWSQIVGSTQTLLSILSADINGDAKDDIVANIEGMGLYWRDSAANTWNPILGSTQTLLSILSADINGDDKDDIVANIEGMGLYWNDSATSTWHPILGSTHTLLSVLSGNINGDDKDDIVANKENMGLCWRDSATNTWNPIIDSTYTLLSTLSADINGDGKDDVVTDIKGSGLYWRDSATGDWSLIIEP